MTLFFVCVWMPLSFVFRGPMMIVDLAVMGLCFVGFVVGLLLASGGVTIRNPFQILTVLTVGTVVALVVPPDMRQWPGISWAEPPAKRWETPGSNRSAISIPVSEAAWRSIVESSVWSCSPMSRCTSCWRCRACSDESLTESRQIPCKGFEVLDNQEHGSLRGPKEIVREHLLHTVEVTGSNPVPPTL